MGKGLGRLEVGRRQRERVGGVQVVSATFD